MKRIKDCMNTLSPQDFDITPRSYEAFNCNQIKNKVESLINESSNNMGAIRKTDEWEEFMEELEDNYRKPKIFKIFVDEYGRSQAFIVTSKVNPKDDTKRDFSFMHVNCSKTDYKMQKEDAVAALMMSGHLVSDGTNMIL